jgi:hypothetical protein
MTSSPSSERSCQSCFRLEWYIKLFLSVHFAANWVSVH